MVEVEVEFDYSANEPDELTIKKGDIIKDVIKKPGGWWEGTLNDKKGVFPDNFVKVIEKDHVVLRNKKDSHRIRQCQVIFSYAQDHEDELNLKVGDIINITGEEEEGWWRGILNGKEGVFPSNFVEEITPSPNKPKPTNRDDILRLADDAPALPAKPVKQLYEAQFAYFAVNDDELTLKEGDIIKLLSKDGQDPGWWRGELNGKIGVFPDNFVVPYQLSTDDRKASSKPTESTSAIKPSSIASQRKSLEIKKAEQSKATPALPGKKPLMSIKKSPSSSSSGNLFAKLKDKLVDAVDGATGSKAKEVKDVKEAESTLIPTTTSGNVFDQVERRPLLSDVRANRARPPGRRLPTSVFKEDDEDIPGIPNGSVADYSVKSEDSVKSEASFSSENLDVSSSSELDGGDVKPRLREWEKHRAPWLEEMKLNQAKRTSVSPVPDLKHKLPDSEAGSKSSQSSPAEKEVNIADMSKSMSDIKLSPIDARPITKSDKTPPLRIKPLITSSVKPTFIGSMPPSKELPPKTTPPQPKLSPKPKQEPQEIISSNTSSYLGYSSSFSHSSEKIVSSTSTSEPVITYKQFQDVLGRLARLELKCDKQAQQIEDLKSRLQVETDMRIMLQEKVLQNNIQV
ncbi:CIN85 and CD2AP related isoform X1 [Rhynchophorus ferrugineus]|uniref:CIN85 and CD2AP related isoform X1 n=1 Tax=Rhynchophorus ferrugineus TaxID=354439 RepID=UPI003FCDEE53